MKSLSRCRRPVNPTAFTLIELLVVIAIIAILAAVTLQVSGSVINAAKRAKAANTATQIQTACLGYYTEYSVYPAPPTTGDYSLDDTSSSGTGWGTLLCVLCGNIHPSAPATTFTTSGATITNSRGIAFLTLKTSDVAPSTSAYADAPLNPLSYVTGTTTNNIFFNIAMDTDYDGLLGTVGNTLNKLPNFQKSTTTAMDTTGTSTAGVAVWANCVGSAKIYPNFWVHTY